MRSPAVKFIVSVIVLTGICAGLQLLWNRQMPDNMQLHNGFLLLGIFAFAVTGIHLFLLSQSNGDGQKFVRSFLAATVLKFFFYIMLLLVFLLFTDENKRALIVHFLFYYAVFTVLEVSMLYGEMQKLKK